MRYYSLNGKSENVSFKEAIFNGIAKDKGLYFPKTIPKLNNSFFENITNLTDVDIAYNVIKPFLGNEIDEADLKEILKDTLNFDFPLVEIEPNIYSMELFHGNTMAFKDVGARFLSRCLTYFLEKDNNKEKISVLVATSGDTGGAVADGFLNSELIDVFILYPKGRVSMVQEKQLTTLGKNIKAIEVNGSFDDCQDIVKSAFLDEDINSIRNLTSANSINIARWLSQMFYYFIAYKKLKHLNKEIVFSVPSGNFGNICAGLLAKKMGLPVNKFIASTNENKVVTDYLKTGIYSPVESKATISNAMDVGNPSNFVRVLELFEGELDLLKSSLESYSFNDDETRKAISGIFISSKYITDPHGAIGYLGLKKSKLNNRIGVFLETAHPIKFSDIVEPIIKESIKIPKQIEKVINAKKESFEAKNYEEVKRYLINCFKQ
ncbi:MAG: threonine synthase [Flavobacteriaceae bacterium]|nr:threonine synthase [Flavobacteriaceae bacterium]